MSEEWTGRAFCKGAPLGLFIPREQRDDEDNADYRKVVHRHTEYGAPYCEVCPVRAECFAMSMKQRITEGIFGGVNSVMRARWLKAGRKWRCKCGRTIDPLELLNDPDLDTCQEHRADNDSRKD